MYISIESKVGELATQHPLATRVFARHGIDFCCGGGKPLAEVCEERGLQGEQILEEIRSVLKGRDEDRNYWIEAPLEALIEHIVESYHWSLREELPRLENMARKVVEVHGAKDPERLSQLLSVLLALRTELEQHMRKEEQILFPMIKEGLGGNAQDPISVMEHEHQSSGAALRRLRELTDDYQPPAGACSTWRALWFGLAALEQDLHQHIHLENNILFPRALAD